MIRIARLSRWPLALFVALVALAMSFGSALAAPSTPKTPKAPAGERAKAALAQEYKSVKLRLQSQDLRLQRADLHAQRIDTLIARMKGKGKDTAALDQAVAAFREALGKARAEWQAASDVLAKHAGFDGDGKVTNLDEARATLKDARGHMEQVHQIAVGAYKNLHAAVVAYRKAHREAVEPVAPVAP